MAADQQTSSNILYFPHIEISDSAWLKSALCVWDSVYRMVPTGSRQRDSDEVRRAVEADALRDINLSFADLTDAREKYHDFLTAVPVIPDAIDKPSDGLVRVHQEKLDERMRSELADLIGTMNREGDWLELPSGVADGYMLFLADTVARRRAIPKLTDSDTMCGAMQYFAMNGNMDESSQARPGGDMSTALIFRYVSPAGIHERSMRDVLEFRKANTEGRHAFHRAVESLSSKVARIDDGEYAKELVGSFIRELQASEKVSLAEIREHFSQPETISLCLGLPVAAKVFEVLSKSEDSAKSLGAIAFSLIYPLSDVLKGRREHR